MEIALTIILPAPARTPVAMKANHDRTNHRLPQLQDRNPADGVPRYAADRGDAPGVRAVACAEGRGHIAKREEQIERVMGVTAGVSGDLQGITGKSLQEMDGLEFPAIDGPEWQQLAVGNGELTWRQQISRPRTTRSENSSATG